MKRRRHRAAQGRRPLAAYHEAGHCLARLYFGHWFDRATLRTMAAVQTGPFRDLRGREVECEGLVEGYDIVSSLMTRDMLRNMRGATPELRAQILRNTEIRAEVALIEAFAGIAAEARYCRISLIAAMLMGGDDDMDAASRILAAWFSNAQSKAEALAVTRARALVRSEPGWRAIEAMAARLLETGEMSGEEGETIFVAAFGFPKPPAKLWAEHWPPTLAMIRAGAAPNALPA